REAASITTGTLEAMGQMITGSRSATELGGIIRIGALAGDMAQQGLIALILFTALLSINLGLVNLFPIPLLDGGHLVFYAFEALLGKPVPEQIQEYAFRLGLTFLVGIMAFANLNDLMQLIL
ncbi:MAG TPA: RIP metalloprotease RseP, partial [Rhodospirillaceae bacterium]|nr:RIP metalloprotease RseP [Rhodospirillaceae bacterium]